MAEKLINWEKLDTRRQIMMYEQLLEINSHATSVNVKEMVKKGLEKGNPF
jgi:hypothetical protein